MKNSTFRTVVKTKSTKQKVTTKSGGYRNMSWENTNALLGSYSGTLGVTDYRWFNLRDNDSSGTDLFDAVGVLRDDYAEKPAFATLRSAIQSIGTDRPRPRRCGGRVATVLGTGHGDRLRGSPGPDVIWAGGGPDRVKARAGRDLICTGKGADRIRAGAGADRIWAGTGRDRCLGGRGRDHLRGCEH